MSSSLRVLVLGITGVYGAAMAEELLARGFEVRALVRDSVRARERFPHWVGRVDWREGDVLDASVLGSAMSGVSVVVHGINAPYPQWNSFVLEAARVVSEAAAKECATVLFPGNLYNFSPGLSLREDSQMDPPTHLGQIRVEMEHLIRASTVRGARCIVLRGGDFFGTGAEGTWMSQLTSKALTGGAILYPGPLEVRHQWAYLPDFVRAHIDLLELELPRFSSFHFEGHQVTGHELLSAIRAGLGAEARPVSSVPWWLIRMGSVVSPLFRELVNMRYLWEEEVLMDGRALKEALSTLEFTPLHKAIAREIALASPGRFLNSTVVEAKQKGEERVHIP